MPITQSAKKALRQNIARRAKNNAKKDALKKILKQYKKLVSEKKPEDAKTALSSAYKLLDKAAKTGTIKKNKASRFKSRLAKLMAE